MTQTMLYFKKAAKLRQTAQDTEDTQRSNSLELFSFFPLIQDQGMESGQSWPASLCSQWVGSCDSGSSVALRQKKEEVKEDCLAAHSYVEEYTAKKEWDRDAERQRGNTETV